MTMLKKSENNSTVEIGFVTPTPESMKSLLIGGYTSSPSPKIPTVQVQYYDKRMFILLLCYAC